MMIVLKHVYQMIEHIAEGVIKWTHLINLGVSLLAFLQDNNRTLALPHSLQGRHRDGSRFHVGLLLHQGRVAFILPQIMVVVLAGVALQRVRCYPLAVERSSPPEFLCYEQRS